MSLRLTLSIVALACLSSAALVSYGALRRADPPTRPWKELLIVAPHPEDDVILASELALEVLADGGSVRVLYVFDGHSPSVPGRAARREADVERAWAMASVPKGSLLFLGLQSSGDLAGPTPDAARQAPAAREALTRAFTRARRGALVHVVAEGEENEEHGFARRLTLDAYEASGRHDLLLLESPFAHPYRSVIQAPKPAVAWVVGQVPGLGRLLWPWLSGPTYPGFVSGGPAFLLPESPSRSALRRRMLRSFSSESEAFLRFFDYPSRYREVDLEDATASLAGYFELGSDRVSISVLFLGLAVGVLTFSLGALLCRALVRVLSGRLSVSALRWVGAGLSLAILAIAAVGLGGHPLRPYWLVAMALGMWLSTPTAPDEESGTPPA